MRMRGLDPKKKDVHWHGDARDRCAVYLFNTKKKDQLFCPRCGASLGIDFREEDDYGISVRLESQPFSCLLLLAGLPSAV